MKQFCISFILLYTVLCCKNDYDKILSPLELLPNQAEAIMVINEFNDFTNSVENHHILKPLFEENFKPTNKLLKHLNVTKEVYIAFLEESKSDYLLLTQNDSLLMVLDSTIHYKSYPNLKSNITRFEVDSTIFYTKIVDDIFTASNNIDVLKDLNSKPKNEELLSLLKTTNKKSIASLAFTTNSKNYSKLFFDVNQNKSDHYTVLDLNFSNDDFMYTGIIKSQDSIPHKIDYFKNTIPQKINTLNIAPSNTNSLLSITYDDFGVFNKNLKAYYNIHVDSTETFLNFTSEIARIGNTLALYSLDADIVLEMIEKTGFETFRGSDIYEFNNPSFFKTRLQPLIHFENANYVSKYGDFIIFSDTIEHLKSILSHILSNNTIANSEAFNNLSTYLNDEASIFIFKNAEGLSDVLNINTERYDANILQLIYEYDYAHVNGVIQKYRKKATSNSVSEAFSVATDAPIIIPPQTVKNHITGAHDIVTQDANNNLYLISSSGDILWKKQLSGKVLGKVKQIDMYKNGRLQLAFTTLNQLHVIDRNGNDVNPFPKTFNNDITQPLSVFDYERTKNYRLLVTQNKNLLMFDAKGNPVNGFNYKSNNNSITTQPKHFRIAKKDYIVFATEDQLKILNRKGQVRINVMNTIRFSKNEIYLYQNKFTASNTLGQLIQVSSKGTLSRKNLNLPEEHSINTTNKTLVSMAENVLNIKSRRLDLDYGNYTKPQIFYLNDKIYVTTTDLQSKKVYLFDSKAKPIPNFPVFGTSAAQLQQLDGDSSLELITQVDDKTILIYKIN